MNQQKKIILTLTAVPVLLLMVTAQLQSAFAWDGEGSWGGGYHHHYWSGGGGCGYNCGGGSGIGIGNLLSTIGLWGGNGGGGSCEGCGQGQGGEGGYYNVGYQAGIQDAIYDHQNNLVYTGQPSCLSCHSQLYLDGFRKGYDTQWNSYQNQESTQGTSMNIYDNNNYVNTAQNNEQNQQGPNPNSDFNPPCLGSCEQGQGQGSKPWASEILFGR